MAERLSSSFEPFHITMIGIPVIEQPHGRPSAAWARDAVSRLSRRERQILPLLAARWTDREIADALSISYRTVTTHVTNIYNKLGIGSRREVVPFALAAEGMPLQAGASA
jgi:DNA-binding NarL/FixJ family response regulator